MQKLTNKRTALETEISLLKCRYPFSNIRLLPLLSSDFSDTYLSIFVAKILYN